ncbi:MAG: hypothetical protein RL272_1137 [Candidatus Parcubacteria bacterium]|jgi:hypothetical protein
MSDQKIPCTAPGCRKCLGPEALWLPERKAREAANGGKRTGPADFPRFALCGYHGHLLRQEGVRVYRYADEVEREAKADRRRDAEQLSWKPFAERFVIKTTAQSKGDGKPRAPRGDGRHVGQGLSRCAKEDAVKRRSKEYLAAKAERDKQQEGAPPAETAPTGAAGTKEA